MASRQSDTRSQHTVVVCPAFRVDEVADALRRPFYNGMLLGCTRHCPKHAHALGDSWTLPKTGDESQTG